MLVPDAFSNLISPYEKKLLIIEDEKSVAKQLRWGLDKEYEITIAPDAKKAKPLLASGIFPVATLDLGLPPHPDTPQQGFALLEGKYSSCYFLMENYRDTTCHVCYNNKHECNMSKTRPPISS